MNHMLDVILQMDADVYKRQPKNKTLQLLMEADLIINCYESHPSNEKIKYIKDIFKTSSGKELLELCIKGIKE